MRGEYVVCAPVSVPLLVFIEVVPLCLFNSGRVDSFIRRVSYISLMECSLSLWVLLLFSGVSLFSV